MNIKNLILLPLVFVAGIFTIVLLNWLGLVNFGPVEGRDYIANSTSPDIERSLTLADASDGIIEGPGIPSNKDLSNSVEDLYEQLQVATVKTDLLESQIAQLNEQVENVNEQVEKAALNAELAVNNNEFLPRGESAAPQRASSGNQGARNNQFNRNGQFFGASNDEQYEGLIAAGVDPSVADDLKQRTAQWELQRLELVDQASREGWRRSDQFGERLSELQEERPDIRTELGDDQYDRYLFSSGQSNRVQISNIIDGSAAQSAGLEVGDVVISYASSRVFSPRDLQRATREGLRDESVQINFIRNQQAGSVQLPRGPLGVSLSGLRSDPDDF